MSDQFGDDVDHLRAQLPQHCPKCSYDPEGDQANFVSGGGWEHDNSVSDGIFTEIFRCWECGTVVAQKEHRMDGGRL